MNLEYDYYFNNYEDNLLFKEILNKSKSLFDMNNMAKEILQKNVVDKNLKENNGELLGENVTFLGNYYIGKGTKIYPGVTIEGPVYIGENVKIMPGAYVRPGTIVGNKCVVGFNSEIKNTVMQDGAKVASLAFVGDSVLGRAARIGSGVITANRRFDQQNIKIKQEDGEKIDTGSAFFGLIIGDYSRIGANSVTSPGTIIGSYTWVYPQTSLSGFIPSEKRVYNNKEIVMEKNNKTVLK